MANFLDSIRTLFKLSGSQAFPTNESRIVLTNSQTRDSYIAPSDGYFGFYNDNPSTILFDMYSTAKISAGRITSFQYSSGNCASGTIPVKKGDVVEWLSNTTITEMWFVPSTGSQ